MKLSQTIARTRSRKTIRGQGMSEYLIIVGLIAVAGIAVMGLFGGAVRNQLGGMAAELGGDSGNAGTARQQANDDGIAAAGDSVTRRNLSNWDGGNDQAVQ